MVVYGPSGSGKTTIASTFPKPLLLLDIKEKTSKTVRGIKDLLIYPIEKFEDVKNDSLDEEDLFDFLRDNPDRFKTIVIDTIGQLQDLALKETVESKGKRLNPGQSANDWGVLTRKDWGNVAGLMKTTIQDLRDLDYHIVFIAQDRIFKIDEEDDDESIPGRIITTPEVGPQVMPSVAKTLNAAVDVIGNTFIQETFKTKKIGKKKKAKTKRVVEYCMRIGPHSLYRTKVRKSKEMGPPPPVFIVDPNFEKIEAISKGETSG